jgi:hypothetical protein
VSMGVRPGLATVRPGGGGPEGKGNMRASASGLNVVGAPWLFLRALRPGRVPELARFTSPVGFKSGGSAVSRGGDGGSSVFGSVAEPSRKEHLIKY